MKNRSKKNIIAILIILLIIFGSGYLKYKNYIHDPVDATDQKEISFQIKRGEAAKEIGKNLAEIDLIKSKTAFYIYVRQNSLAEQIIAGRFLLKRSMNVPEILDAITDAKQAEFIITIQEGLTIKDIDNKLVELSLINSGEFLEAVRNFDGYQYYDFLDKAKLSNLTLPLEGYLYPDTYFLDPGDFQTHDLIYLALDNFEKKIAEISPQNSKYNFHEIITMASIIENEVISKKDRELVSGILWKRLENGWPLGADATLLYITVDRKIDANDLNLDSPYNTRKILGLPPGPISNPSLSSINAAMSPVSSPYWFYLTSKTGETVYSKTNEEQNLNREKHL